jgi:nucleotide-binding universal stress UspA family protein
VVHDRGGGRRDVSDRTRNMLVAMDGSVASLKAARLAVGLAGSCDARVRLVAVLEEAAPPNGHNEGEREAQLRDTLAYVRRLGSEAGLDVEAVVRRGRGVEPYETILAEADQWPADLLFLGRRSHRGLGRALLGSQAEHVLEFAQLPVVVGPAAGPSRTGSI